MIPPGSITGSCHGGRKMSGAAIPRTETGAGISALINGLIR